MLPVLYDGWSLSYHPNSPAALHLLALLACCPAEQQALVALPAEPPPWFPTSAVPQVRPAPNTPRAHLGWEQRTLPQLAVQLAAKILHLVTPSPPLLGRLPTVVSPAGTGLGTRAGEALDFFERLRFSASGGGMARLGALLWPEDLPDPAAGHLPAREGGNVFRLPPAVHPDFLQPGAEDLSELGLPVDFVLYHGPGSRADLRRLFEIWSWAAGPVGEYYPLILLGLDEVERSGVRRLAEEYALAESVRSLPCLSPGEVAAVYRSCSALLHPNPVSPWGDPLRLALASGKPAVVADSPLADALVGPAAYLAPAEDPRALGAALITILVEEELAGRLSQAALLRAAPWKLEVFSERLLEVYRLLLSPNSQS